MVHEQLIGPGRGLTNERVLAAMSTVPRHEFIPEPEQGRAYHDRALPIGFGQTISQPYIVGLMSEQLNPRPTDRILEIGTGCGYQAAVLSQLVKEVYSIEIIEPLAQRAAETLHRLGYHNVYLRLGDGNVGWPEAAPFDAIVVTCAPDHVPPALLLQLREDGRMMIPIGPQDDQQLYLYEKHNGQLERTSILAVRFVPMTGQIQQG